MSPTLETRVAADPLAAAYQSHKDALLTMAFHLLGERSAAEDVLHDVFVKLVRRRVVLRDIKDLKGYLLMSCLNRARDYLRKKRPDLVPVESLDRHAHAGVDATTTVGRHDEAASVARRLRTLPDEQREVVVLRVYGELRFPEIGTLCGISPNTARSRYRYAMTSLRSWMSEEGAPA